MSLHCWEDKREYMIRMHGWASPEHIETYGGLDGPDKNATCMLPDGHVGEHEWTPDSEIGVSFAPEPSEAS